MVHLVGSFFELGSQNPPRAHSDLKSAHSEFWRVPKRPEPVGHTVSFYEVSLRGALFVRGAVLHCDRLVLLLHLRPTLVLLLFLLFLQSLRFYVRCSALLSCSCGQCSLLGSSSCKSYGNTSKVWVHVCCSLRLEYSWCAEICRPDPRTREDATFQHAPQCVSAIGRRRCCPPLGERGLRSLWTARGTSTGTPCWRPAV